MMTTVFILFSARTILNCVLDMGNFELKHSTTLGKMTSLSLEKILFQTRTKKKEDVFWIGTYNDAPFCKIHDLFFRSDKNLSLKTKSIKSLQTMSKLQITLQVQ